MEVYLKFEQVNLIVASLTNPSATKTSLAKKAGYKVAEGSKVNHLFKPIEGKLGKALLHLGISEMDLLAKTTELLNAKKPYIYKNNVKTIHKNGDITIKTTVEVIEMPDNPVQRDMLKMIFSLGDYFPAGKLKVDHKHGGEVTFSQKMALDERKALEAKMEADDKEIAAEFEVADETIN